MDRNKVEATSSVKQLRAGNYRKFIRWYCFTPDISGKERRFSLDCSSPGYIWQV